MRRTRVLDEVEGDVDDFEREVEVSGAVEPLPFTDSLGCVSG